MGMDVYGRNPSSEEGRYFRASIWSWPSVLTAIEATGTEVPESWRYNDGEGYETQEECTALADKLDELVERKPIIVPEMLPGAQALKDAVEGADWHLPDEGPEGLELTVEAFPDPNLPADLDHAAEFSKFLRQCGGFEIW